MLGYVQRREKESLALIQPPLGRVTSTLAAIDPDPEICRRGGIWRRTNGEQSSKSGAHHISDGMRYLPAIAAALVPVARARSALRFLDLVRVSRPPTPSVQREMTAALPATEEWQYVEREVDIRLSR